MRSLEELAEFNKKHKKFSRESLPRENLREISRILNEVKSDFQKVFEENPSYEYVGKRIDVEFNNVTSAIDKYACRSSTYERLRKDCVNSLTRLVETFPDGDLPKELQMLRTEVATLVDGMKTGGVLGLGYRNVVPGGDWVPCLWSQAGVRGFVQSANELIAVAKDVEGEIGKALTNTWFLYPPADPYLVVAHSQVRSEIGRLAVAMRCFFKESKEYVTTASWCAEFARWPEKESDPDQNAKLKDYCGFWSGPGTEAANALDEKIPVREVRKKGPLKDGKVNSKAKIREVQNERRIACLEMARWLSATASAVEKARVAFAVDPELRSGDPRCWRLVPWAERVRELNQCKVVLERSKLGDGALKALRGIFRNISRKLNAAATAMENLDAYTNSGAAQTVLKRGTQAHAADFWETYSRVAYDTLNKAPFVSPFDKNYVTTKYKPFIEQLDELTKPVLN